MRNHFLSPKRIIILFCIVALITILVGSIILYIQGTKGMARIHIGDTVLYAEIADTPEERIRGLQGRTELADRHGMLFVFSEKRLHSFWMKDTLIPLDFVWIADNTIVGVTENVPAGADVPEERLQHYLPPEPVNMVLELPAGSAKQHAIEDGKGIRIQ